MRTRGRSLFWTISGLFVLAVVVGTVIQAVVALAVLRPLQARETRSRAELAASGLAAEIAAKSGPWSAGELHRLLERHHATLGRGPSVVGYRDGDGWQGTEPPGRTDFLDHALSGAPLPRAPTDGAGRAPRPRQELVVRHPVMRGAERVGEVVIVRPLWPRGGPGLLELGMPLLFLPVALIASVVVGLLMVRILVRRLRAMEMLAARVAEGDLTVRIGDPGGDEIGRLADRLDRMTERLLDARNRVEDAEQQRRQLFADITHELATPLTSIRGYAETLLDPGVSVSDEERGRYLRGVLEESRRLDRLIRDLFDLARLEAGASPLALEPLDWTALCRNTTERFAPRFRDAGLGLRWPEPAAEAWIRADGHRMEQVLENLLVNAMRYVPAGGTVEISLARPPLQADRYRLVVSDDGPGLSADERAHVFERFYRAAGTRGAGEGGGSGLGLAIVREIVERHGGTVGVEPREPHGLAFFVELPANG